jgi:hypothetical protein
MKLSQKFFVLLSRQYLDEIVCWHLCSQASIHTDSIRLNLLSQSVSININMFQFRVKFQYFFFQHAKNLTNVAAYVQFFLRIVLNWFEKSSSSNCFFAIRLRINNFVSILNVVIVTCLIARQLIESSYNLKK